MSVMSIFSSLLDASVGSAIIALIVSGYAIYYFRVVVKVPQLICGASTSYRTFLEENLPILQEKFWPTVWCITSHAQTVLGAILPSSTTRIPNYRREILRLKDGGEVALDWLEDGCAQNAPIVLILPGLTGHSQAIYIRCLVKSANLKGLRTVVFNNRGLGGHPLKTSRLYNACNYEDLTEVIKNVKKNYPDSPLAATGISMGGLVLGNYIASKGKDDNAQLVGAMLISVPWNVFKAIDNIEKPGLNRILDRYLASSLANTVLQQKEFSWDDYQDALKSKSLREFDSKFTSKVSGYSDVHEYYSHATLHNKLDKFAIPTLCLTAADDPLQPEEALPMEEFKKSKYVATVLTTCGGHIGFMEGLWPKSLRDEDRYLGRVFSQFMVALFKGCGQKKIGILTSALK